MKISNTPGNAEIKIKTSNLPPTAITNDIPAKITKELRNSARCISALPRKEQQSQVTNLLTVLPSVFPFSSSSRNQSIQIEPEWKVQGKWLQTQADKLCCEKEQANHILPPKINSIGTLISALAQLSFHNRNAGNITERTSNTTEQASSNAVADALQMVASSFNSLSDNASFNYLIPIPETGKIDNNHDLFSFPFAQAAPVPFLDGAIEWNKETDFYIVKDESMKGVLIASLKDFLVNSNQLTANEGQEFEFLLKQEATNSTFIIAPVQEEKSSLSRTKRESLEAKNRRVEEHIQEHCAFQTEIFDTEGNNEGKILILKAQNAENPLRMLYSHGSDTHSSPETAGTANGLNILANIFSLGIKPAVGAFIANNYRRQYYQQRGDQICTTRQNHLDLAEIATLIDVSGLPHNTKKPGISKKPTELINSIPLPERAAYYGRNKHTGVQRELLMKMKTPTAIRDNGNEILLKPTKNGEFVTWYPDAVNPERLERRVLFDEKKAIWRYADEVDSTSLNVDIQEGKTFIKLHAERYELQMDLHGQHEIVVKKTSGVKEYIPVYMEPLSKTWHLTARNEYPVFDKRQQKFIDKISISPEADKNYHAVDNLRPDYYGDGKIFAVRPKGKNIFENAPLYFVAEINGKLVPVRQNTIKGHGVTYEAYDMKNPNRPHSLLEWDGERWIFEQPTSAHVSTKLKNTMLSNKNQQPISANQLSAPDHRGLRWDANNNSYLKINDNFVKIIKLNKNRFSIKTEQGKHNVYLRYSNNKFKIETARERFNNILSEGLNGKRKRQTASELLREQDGFNRESAEKLLAEYQFPKNGLNDDYSFALDIAQTGTVPQWANQFKKARTEMEPALEAGEPVITVSKIDQPGTTDTLRLGEMIGEGATGEVYLDKKDNGYVIKKYTRENDSDEGTDVIRTRNILNDEQKMFQRYYGEESAITYLDSNGVGYMRMYRIPGQTLENVPANSLPLDTIERYVDMLENMNHVDIIHGDLHLENVIWDAERKMFHPIDISNIHDTYFKGNLQSKVYRNEVGEEEWENMIKAIKDRMVAE